MKKRGDRHRLKQIRKEVEKENKFLNWFIFVFGLVSFVLGLIQLLFFKPEIAINSRYLQPTIDNGGLLCITGFILLVASIYRFRNKEKIIKDTYDLEKDDL